MRYNTNMAGYISYLNYIESSFRMAHSRYKSQQMPGKTRWVAFHATHLGLPGIFRRVFFIKKRAS